MFLCGYNFNLIYMISTFRYFQIIIIMLLISMLYCLETCKVPKKSKTKKRIEKDNSLLTAI